jgi:HK97 gp10 family phage protein
VSLSSFAQLAARLATAEADMKFAKEAILEKACQIVEDRAKAAIGTYEFGWPQLAQSTQEQRVAQGYSANNPLLRTGELRSSIGHYVDGDVGYVGTNDPNAKYHEFGTSKMPPRPFLGPAVDAAGPKIEKMAGRMVMGAMLHGGPAYHELKEVLHVLKEVYHEGKEAAEEFLEDDRDESR